MEQRTNASHAPAVTPRVLGQTWLQPHPVQPVPRTRLVHEPLYPVSVDTAAFARDDRLRRPQQQGQAEHEYDTGSSPQDGTG